MTIIYIEGLLQGHTPVAVCRALFIAAARTDAGHRQRQAKMKTSAFLPGLTLPLADYEIQADFTKATLHYQGRLQSIGYLTVDLVFKLDSSDGLDVTSFEAQFGISAKVVLEDAGFKCSDTSAPVASKPTVTPPMTTSSDLIARLLMHGGEFKITQTIGDGVRLDSIKSTLTMNASGELQSSTTVQETKGQEPPVVSTEMLPGGVKVHVASSSLNTAGVNPASSLAKPKQEPLKQLSEEKKDDGYFTSEVYCTWDKKTLFKFKKTPGKPNKIVTDTMNNIPGMEEPKSFLFVTWDGRKNQFPLVPRTYELDENNYMDDWTGMIREEMRQNKFTVATYHVPTTKAVRTSEHSGMLSALNSGIFASLPEIKKLAEILPRPIKLPPNLKSDLEKILGEEFPIENVTEGSQILHDAIAINFKANVNSEKLKAKLKETLLVDLPYVQLITCSAFPPVLNIRDNDIEYNKFLENVSMAVQATTKLQESKQERTEQNLQKANNCTALSPVVVRTLSRSYFIASLGKNNSKGGELPTQEELFQCQA